jgi:hypothetical protein
MAAKIQRVIVIDIHGLSEIRTISAHDLTKKPLHVSQRDLEVIPSGFEPETY